MVGKLFVTCLEADEDSSCRRWGVLAFLLIPFFFVILSEGRNLKSRVL